MTALLLLTLLACTDKDTTSASGDTGDTPADCEPSDEVCDGLDNDCDGSIDEDAADTVTLYADADSDGFGDDLGVVLGCPDTTGFSEVGGDCDDTDAAVNPDATEVCDGADNDCDDRVDDEDDDVEPGAVDPVYPDADGDGYGDAATEILACSPPTGHVADGSDCNDDDPWIHPGAAELCDGVRTDCDDTGWTDDAGLAGFYSDSTGTWTDLTDALGAGTADTPVAYTLDDAGRLGLCAGTWHVQLTLEQAVQVVGVDGAEAVVITGDDTHSLIVIEHAAAVGVVSDVSLQNGLADHTLSLGDDIREVGGAVWCTGGGSLTLDGVVLRDNTSSGYGGAVGVEGCDLSMSGVTATGNRGYHGGVLVGLEATVTVDSSTFADNSADVEGGAFYLGGGVTLTLSDSSFGAHDAYEGGVLRSEERGRAGSNSLTVTDSSFTGATATLGGVLSAEDGGEIVIEGSTFSGNLAYDRGGAVLVDVLALTVTSSVFDGNEALDDGGAMGVTAESLTLDGSTFSSNGAEDGGALDLDVERAVITDCEFTDNAASRSGGAVALRADGAELDATGLTFSDNTAARDGGAIYASDGASLSCESCAFDDNASERSGGAIAADVADVALQDSSLSDNAAGDDRLGGALWMDNGSLSADAVTFSGNTAGSGGAVALERVVASVASATFADNTADEGGGVYLSLSTLDVSASDFSGNVKDDTYVSDAEDGDTWGTGATFSCDLAGCAE